MLDKCTAFENKNKNKTKKEEPPILRAAHVVVRLDSLIAGEEGVIFSDVCYNEF